MQLDKLQLDLRPRSNPQALDLGFALLRPHAADVYLAWLALWLPLIAVCSVLAYLTPNYSAAWWLMLAWWLKPLLERAPLYILSRQVFGETVTWRQALRAWPGQLRGGWFRLLTWWRPFVPGRGLYQAIWQLEGARGAVATDRRKVIGSNNTGRSASWFGVICAHFEMVLQFGFIAFIGIFLSHENAINPFSYFFGTGAKVAPLMTIVVTFIGYAIAGGIIGPIYTACCFTLYLNRRATLEAWDIEIMLRQIAPPTANKARVAVALMVPAILILTLSLYQPIPAQAAESSSVQKTCDAPKWLQDKEKDQTSARGPDQSAEQTRLRNEVATLFATDDLRGYICINTWSFKNWREDTPPKKTPSIPDFLFLAGVLRIMLIAGAIMLVAWLLYRYRGKFYALTKRPGLKKATEVGGLDIRPETLPDDVAGAVRLLWEQKQYRAALALLYRATLSRLVEEDAVLISRGATEGDCLRLARQANATNRLSLSKLDIVTSATTLWLRGAYGGRWPDTDTVLAHCTQWQSQFGKSVTSGQVTR
ncbi:MAG TPA: hypothetical protein VIF82_16875 [Burkholderiaceae bacterium]|jgi:hypothetical protein